MVETIQSVGKNSILRRMQPALDERTMQWQRVRNLTSALAHEALGENMEVPAFVLSYTGRELCPFSRSNNGGT